MEGLACTQAVGWRVEKTGIRNEVAILNSCGKVTKLRRSRSQLRYEKKNPLAPRVRGAGRGEKNRLLQD